LILYKFPVGGAKEQMWSAYLGNNDARFSKNISLLAYGPFFSFGTSGDIFYDNTLLQC